MTPRMLALAALRLLADVRLAAIVHTALGQQDATPELREACQAQVSDAVTRAPVGILYVPEGISTTPQAVAASCGTSAPASGFHVKQCAGHPGSSRKLHYVIADGLRDFARRAWRWPRRIGLARHGAALALEVQQFGRHAAAVRTKLWSPIELQR